MNAQRIALDAGPYTDESIHHWADVYADRRVHDYGVHFDSFMQAPQTILDRIDAGLMKRLDQI